jgi:2-dehydropantoate 2-reductase
MSKENARMLVIGAGVNGSICASALRTAGIDTTILARGERAQALRERGIVIEDSLKGSRSVTRVPVVESLEAEEIYDYVLVVVHRHQVDELLPVLARNRSPNVVFMSNNLSGAEGFAPIGRERVLLGFVFGGGKREGDIVRATHDVGGALGAIFGGVPFGEPEGSVSPRLLRLVGLFRRAGLDARVSSKVPDYLSTHASLIALGVCVFAKHDGDELALARSTRDLELLIDALREVYSFLPAVGFRIEPPKFGMVQFIPRPWLVSMLRSFLRSSRMDFATADMSGDWRHSQTYDEVLFLAKELRALAARSGRPAPAARELLAGLEGLEGQP